MSGKKLNPTLAALAGLLLVLSSPLFSQDNMENISYTGILAGSEVGSVETTAGCSLSGFDISLDILASGNNWAGDMAMAITAPNGNRIELGGYNMNFGYVDIGSWPTDWNSNVDGNFTASFTDLDPYNLGGSGCWLIEFMNAWSTGGASQYSALVTLHGLCSEGDFPGCTDAGALNFDPCAMADDGSCVFPILDAAFHWTSLCGLPETISFEDLSTGDVQALSWTFESGSPLASDSVAPSVTWAEPGTYAIGLTVSDSNGDTAFHSDTVTVGANLHRLEIDFTPDAFPQETGFFVLGPNNDTLYSGGIEGLDACLSSGCTSVWLTDSGADGFSVGGGYQIRYDGQVLRDNEHFDALQLTLVGCPVGSSCDDPLPLSIGVLDTAQVLTSPMQSSWYRMDVDSTGQYLFSTCDLTPCDTRIHLYDYCDMAVFESSSEAFITMSDNDCGMQSVVTPLLTSGQTIYIHIEGGCTDGSDGVSFEASYLGGIPGCMNIEACNYLPIATDPDTCYLIGDPECPNIGPDLIINGPRAFSTLEYTTESSSDGCMIEEGCLQGYGTREIVRFDTEIANIGTEDYFIGAPSDNPEQFEWDACHNHYHYEGYAEYALYTSGGSPLPTIGFKNGFCIMDLGSCNYGGGPTKYTCSNMGITAGCQDIYSRFLDCQWVDITDLPGGDYTLVIRVNWDYSPDANGSFELSYANNAVAVCFSFERDADGNATNFAKYQDCPVPTDCIGHPYGTAEPDCAGNCPGFLVKGDVDMSGEVDAADPLIYAQLLMEEETSDSPCVDLNADGELTVTDLALSADCAHYGHDHLGDNGVENHCDWNGPLLVPDEQVQFSLILPHEDSSHVDIYVHNPNTWLSGWSLQLNGAQFSDLTPLFDTTGYHHLFHLSPDGFAFGVALQDSLITKSTLPQPLFRVNFSQATAELCLLENAEVTNHDRHNVSAVGGGCVIPGTFCLGDVNDNGLRDVGDLLTALGVFGCDTDCGPADVDSDGFVGVNDLLIMLGLFGEPCQ
jgi:PKD repeat protein